MSVFHMVNPFQSFYRNWKAGKLLYALAFLSVFVSACSPPKNTHLLNEADPIPASYLVWSPTGNELAITAIRGNPPVSAIYILEFKTRKMRLVVNQDFGDVDVYSWTPDGKQLAFFAFSNKDNKQVIGLADQNGIDPPKFLGSDIALAGPPAGEMVIFRKDNTAQKVSLYLHNIDTNSETNIFSSAGVAINSLFWSSDGSKLVFAFQKEWGKSSIYTFDSSTKRTTQVIPNEDVWTPSLSPDGKLIAYTKWDPNSSSLAEYLHIMKSDGSCDVEVPGHFDVYSPTWSPDGKYIAYVGKTDSGIYLLDLVGALGKDIVKEGLSCP